jgi:hypothetical protein
MNWVIVEVVIGLSFLFFLLSIVASAVNEAFAGLFKLRARTLERGIKNLLTGSTHPSGEGLGIVDELYAHSLVNGYGKNKDKPSYLSSRSFRNALLDVTNLLDATEGPNGDPVPIEQIRADVEAKINEIPVESVRDTLTTIWRSAGRNATEFRAGVERWFDRGMERVSGWYKRRTQIILFIVGIAVAVIVNANALSAADNLWRDDALRKGLVAQVENTRADTKANDALDRLEDLQFPVGWQKANQPHGTDEWIVALLGWVLTGVAISFGAPFWFDLLNKVANLRAAGRRPDSTVNAASPNAP